MIADVLAFVLSDPTAIPLWGIALLSLCMYPLGFMLGAPCSRCCAQCSDCAVGSLPRTLTVTLNNMPNASRGPDLIAVQVESCFGSGAQIRVLEPGGYPDTDTGPLSEVEVTKGGSGYAQIGRVEPTLTLTGSGSGATFTATLASENDECGIPTWSIASVSISGSGSGYLDGESLMIEAAEGDEVVANAEVTIETTRTEPELTATATPGDGAVFTVNTAIAENVEPDGWEVVSVDVEEGGAGYVDGTELDFVLGEGTFGEGCIATIRTAREEPEVSVGFDDSSAGSGAVLTLTLEQDPEADPPFWVVTSIDVEEPGSGYEQDEQLVSITSDTEQPFFATLNVDEDGAIQSVTVIFGGEYFRDTGVIESVEVTERGGYYKDDGIPTSATVVNGGIYYREDPSVPAYVAEPTITLVQTSPSAGTGATLEFEIDDDPGSETFGQVVGVTIAEAGSGYLAWEWLTNLCCGQHYDGREIVLVQTSNPCVYEHRFCGVGNLRGRKGRLRLTYRGPSQTPLLSLESEVADSADPNNSVICDVAFSTASLVTDCDDWGTVSFGSDRGATATVVSGGDYDETFLAGDCFICCRGADVSPAEIEAGVVDNRTLFNPLQSLSGTYVLSRGLFGSTTGWSFFRDSQTVDGVFFPEVLIVVSITTCSEQLRDRWSTSSNDAAYESCGQCYESCAKTAFISIGGNLFFVVNCDGVDCGDCQETPVCLPQGGTFNLCVAGANCESSCGRMVLTV
jgi:hypothetical protein